MTTRDKLRDVVARESKGTWSADIAATEDGWKVRLLACFAKCKCGVCRLAVTGESYVCECGAMPRMQVQRTYVALPADRAFAVDRLENFFTELAHRDPSTLPETVEVEYP